MSGLKPETRTFRIEDRASLSLKRRVGTAFHARDELGQVWSQSVLPRGGRCEMCGRSLGIAYFKHWARGARVRCFDHCVVDPEEPVL